MNNYPFHLRAGDVVRYEGQNCAVVRVTDCAAVLAMTKPARQFTTRFGSRVCFQPKPAFVRISPDSQIPILNR